MSTSPTSTLCCPTTPPVSTTAGTTSPLKRRPHGRPPSAGTTTTQSSGSPKFERSENAFNPRASRSGGSKRTALRADGSELRLLAACGDHRGRGQGQRRDGGADQDKGRGYAVADAGLDVLV